MSTQTIWRKCLFNNLRERNQKERDQFCDIILSYTKLVDLNELLKRQTNDYNEQISTLKQENRDLQKLAIEGGGSRNELNQISNTEQKLLKAQEELNTIYKMKGDNAQALIDLKEILQKKEKDILNKDSKIIELELQINSLKEANKDLLKSLYDKELTNETLNDELTALQLAYTNIESQLQQKNMECVMLEKKLLEAQEKNVEIMNKELDLFEMNRKKEITKQIADAIKSSPCISETYNEEPFMKSLSSSMVPTKPLCQFDAHEGEVNGIKWTPSGRYFATAGADKRVKLWEKIGKNVECKSTFGGFNSAVLSVAFDENEKYLIASSADKSIQFWNLDTRQVGLQLTGHSDKVFSVKFITGNDSSKIASGSSDKTIRVWDLTRKSCIKTLCPASNCYDLIAYGSTIVSGHHDKKIRQWDIRNNERRPIGQEIIMKDKITSLDLSIDKTKLLCSTRDDCLTIIDFRKNKEVLCKFKADGFHVALDYSRAVFSHDESHVMAGSFNGSLYIWNVQSNSLAYTLIGHNAPIIDCSWHPYGSALLSSDRQRKCILWADF